MANAGIRACKLADGSTVFQDTACEVVPQAKPQAAAALPAVPFGIEESWFDTPPVVPDRAVCTEAGCHCGMYSRKFKAGLSLAIADALYLDGSWHRLENTMAQIEQAPDNALEMADLRNARDESACNILMSQKILRVFGKETLKTMRKKKRYAEDMGLDNPDDCDAGDMTVCDYTDIIMTYDRIVKDIKSLSLTSRSGEELIALDYQPVDTTALELGAAYEGAHLPANQDRAEDGTVFTDTQRFNSPSISPKKPEAVRSEEIVKKARTRRTQPSKLNVDNNLIVLPFDF